MRGAFCGLRGDYDRGIADFQAAVRLNPHDPAATFEDWPKTQLTPADLKHGQEQVRQMLKDRPAMAQYGDEAGVLYSWAVRKFAGEDLGQRIFWDPADPPDTSADHFSPTATSPGRVRVRGQYKDGPHAGKERAGEEMWEGVVYELYNILSVKDFRRRSDDAAAGKLSKEEFVVRTAEVENRAGEKEWAFYLRVFLLWAKDHHLSTNPRVWHMGAHLHSPENHAPPLTVDDGPYRRHIERQYDWIVLNSLAENHQNGKAIKLASGMLEREGRLHEKAHLFQFRAAVYGAGGEWERAIADLTEAIRLEPENAKAYVGRGWAYEGKGDYPKCIDDCTDAIRLDPKLAEAYNYRGIAYADDGQPDKAIVECREAIRLKPKYADAYYNRARAYHCKGEYDAAIADYTEAIRLGPGMAHAYWGRGTCYRETGEKAKADEDFARAKKLGYTGK